MSRGLDGAQLAAAAASHRIAVPLIEMYFHSGTLRITLCPWSITVGADTYASAVVVQFRQLHESVNSIEGIEFTANGLDPAVMTLATMEPNKGRGRLVRLLKAYLHPDTHALIGAPKVVNDYRIRSIPIQETNSECKLTIIAEHYDAELGRAAPTRLNDSDQQRFFPGDLGCQYAEQMVEKIIVWPSLEAYKQ